jgi:hypothetical protein
VLARLERACVSADRSTGVPVSSRSARFLASRSTPAASRRWRIEEPVGDLVQVVVQLDAEALRRLLGVVCRQAGQLACSSGSYGFGGRGVGRRRRTFCGDGEL